MQLFHSAGLQPSCADLSALAPAANVSHAGWGVRHFQAALSHDFCQPAEAHGLHGRRCSQRLVEAICMQHSPAHDMP